MSHPRLSENKTGSQAQLEGRNWVTLRAPTRKNARNRKKILYPRFLECSRLITDDPQWRLIFENAAYGKFPSKFNMNNGRMVYKKNKIVYLDLPYDNLAMIEEVKKFMKTIGNIYTRLDEAHFSRILQEETETEEFSWTKLEKPVREALIYRYGANLKRKYSLNKDEYQACIYTIKYGILMGYINKKHIYLNNRQIENIEGLIFDPNTRIWDIEPGLRVLSKAKTSKPRTKVRKYDKVLESYLNSIQKLSNSKIHSRENSDHDEYSYDISGSENTSCTTSRSISNFRFSRHLNRAAI